MKCAELQDPTVLFCVWVVKDISQSQKEAVAKTQSLLASLANSSQSVADLSTKSLGEVRNPIFEYWAFLSLFDCYAEAKVILMTWVGGVNVADIFFPTFLYLKTKSQMLFSGVGLPVVTFPVWTMQFQTAGYARSTVLTIRTKDSSFYLFLQSLFFSVFINFINVILWLVVFCCYCNLYICT